MADPGGQDEQDRGRLRIRVRLFAVQRELAGTREVPLDLPAGATIEDGWAALVARFPILAPGRPSVRFARNGEYAESTEALADGDELACIPPVSGGADSADEAYPADTAGAAGSTSATGRASVTGPPSATRPASATDADRPIRILELWAEPFPAALAEDLSARLATAADGAIVVFVGRTREWPGTPAPGQEAEAARHAGRTVDALEYEAHEPMALAILAQIADEIAERFAVVRLAIVHRTGVVPLGEASVLVVAASPHRDAAFAAARHAIDETKARTPIWKAERFLDGHVWIGAPARTASSPRPASGERGG